MVEGVLLRGWIDAVWNVTTFATFNNVFICGYKTVNPRQPVIIVGLGVENNAGWRVSNARIEEYTLWAYVARNRVKTVG
jgi:hypothetical protein